MKQKISITIESGTIVEVDDKVKEGIFRNRSHFLEFASNKLFGEFKKK